MKQSNFKSLNLRDLLHVLGVTVGGVLLNYVQETLLPSLNIDPTLKGLISFGIVYLAKKFFQKPTETKFISATDELIGSRPNDR